jgi:D-lactate dehydrogenase
VVPVQAEEGHIFVDEGHEMSQILVLEEGTLIRTKLSVPEQDLPSVRSLRESLSSSSKLQHIADNSVTVDKLEGRGRISGLLHSCRPGTLAYATVSAVTPAKVWLLEASDFRTIVSQTPEYALDLMTVLSKELRAGSKSMRGLILKVKTSTLDDGSGHLKNVVRVLCYDTTTWVSEGFQPAVSAFNKAQLEKQSQSIDAISAVEIQMDFTTERLGEKSATYAAGYDAVCLFVNDVASEKVLQTLSLLDVKMVAMRCAGFDRVDGKAATAYGFTVARVPAYSPYAVAEMAVALLMAVNRKIDRASARIKMANFTLDAGLMGMDIHGKTVAVMGTGKIGQILCRIMLGFEANVICHDIYESDELKGMGCQYVSKEDVYQQSDVIFLMMPLLKPTYHTIDEAAIQQMKPGVLLINTSRGGLMDTKAVLAGIRNGIIGGVGMDVYEHEEAYFFQDWSAKHIQDQDVSTVLAMDG